jgi:hypothetical protein
MKRAHYKALPYAIMQYSLHRPILKQSQKFPSFMAEIKLQTHSNRKLKSYTECKFNF